MITTQLPPRQSKWSKRFLEEKEKVFILKEEARHAEIETRKAYIPKFASCTKFEDRVREIHCVPFNDLLHGPRNKLCSACSKPVGRVNKDKDGEMDCGTGCDLCPAVSHNLCVDLSTEKCCLVDESINFSQVYKKHVSQRLEKTNGNIWCCKLCARELFGSIDDEENRLLSDRSKRAAYFSSLRLQAACMRMRAQQRYRKMVAGSISLQARVRKAYIKFIQLHLIMLHVINRTILSRRMNKLIDTWGTSKTFILDTLVHHTSCIPN